MIEIVALVGPSGSGKSHRASMVATEYQTDAIIDDGLLIADGQIVAGYSAKREATRMAAVRRAILHDPEHARLIREAISARAPRRILVLGTSRNMVQRILAALGLEEAAVRWVDIDAVASPEEIRSALRVRRHEGKHVIPAPTLEVQKTFSGYLVAPLHFIFFHRARGHRVTVEKSIVRPTYSSLGRFTIADTVVAAIVREVASRVPGVEAVRRVVVHSRPTGVEIEWDLVLAVRKDLFGVLSAVADRTRQEIEWSTALTVTNLIVTVRRLSGGRERSARRLGAGGASARQEGDDKERNGDGDEDPGR
jgi:adenylate kinase family enzyme/uncharacterized alkaline shock family protein YloU